MPVRFHYFDLKMVPLASQRGKYTSSSLLKACITEINRARKDDHNAIVLDRNHKNSKELKRELFISTIAIKQPENKYKGTIHLIRDNKNPMLVDRETYKLAPMNEVKNGSMIAETTHFYIDFSKEIPLVCCEFNNDGPRISDIEYYFRQIGAKVLNLSYSCQAERRSSGDIKTFLKNLNDVINIKIKAKPSKLPYLTNKLNESFIARMQGLSNTIENAAIKVETSFRAPGLRKTKSIAGIAFVKRVLGKVTEEEEIIEALEDFSVIYDSNSGTQETFNLTGSLVEFTVDCPLTKGRTLESKQLFNLANVEFDDYINRTNQSVSS